MKADVRERLRHITGRHNAALKELRSGFRQAELSPEGYLAVEGARIVEEAIRSGLRFKAVFVSETGAAHAERLLLQIKAQVEILLVPDKLFAGAVKTEAPKGIAALVKVRRFSLADVVGARATPATAVGVRRPALIVVVAGLQDPGNLGTVIRSSEAFDADGVLLAENTVSAYNQKVIRAAAGTLFRLPVVRGTMTEFIPALKAAGVRILATSSHQGTPLDQAGLQQSSAVVIGGEGAGLAREIMRAADEVIAIPHSAHVESLNAGVAASIVLYEAARQRGSRAWRASMQRRIGGETQSGG